MSSQESDSEEDASQTHYEDLVLVLNKIKVYVEMIVKRLSEVCGEDSQDHPRMLEGTTLRDYQQKGYKWIMTLYENGMNGILADEMGLGKTVQVISALAGLIEAGVPGPFLIVTPLSLLPVWADQLAAFAPRLPSLVYYGPLTERLRLRRRIRKRVRICMSDPLTVVNRASNEPSRSGTTTTATPTMTLGLDTLTGLGSSKSCETQSCSPLNTSSSLSSFPSLTKARDNCPDPALDASLPRIHDDIASAASSAADCLSCSNNSFDSAQLADRSEHRLDTAAENSFSDPVDSHSHDRHQSSSEEHSSSCSLMSSMPVEDSLGNQNAAASSEAIVESTDNMLTSDSGSINQRAEALLHLDEVITEVLTEINQPTLSRTALDVPTDSNSVERTLPPECADRGSNILNEAPHQRTHGVEPNTDGAISARKPKSDVFWAYPIVFTSYEVAMRDATYLRKIPFKGLVVDEGQRLKNPANILYKRLAKFNAGLRILLTGTPLQNRISELWSLLHFVLPELFTSLEMFENWFDPVVLSDRAGRDRLVAAEVERALVTKLHCIISPFMLRRTKAESNLLLPPKREILLRVGMTELQKDLYEQALKLCLDSQQPNSASKAVGNSRRSSNAQGSLTWLDPANIIGDKPSSVPSSASNTQAPMTRLRSQRTKQPTEHGTEKNTDTETKRTTRSQTRATLIQSNQCDGVPPVSDSEPNCTSVTKGKLSISPLVSVNNGLMLLREIANHPYLVIDRPNSVPSDAAEPPESVSDPSTDDGVALIHASEKTRLLDRLLNILITTKHKVLIFSQLAMVLDVLEELLDTRGWSFVRLDGSTKLADRQEAIRRFNYETVEELPVFLVSARAGGCGLNLQTAADTVIIFDSDWNPQTDLQAQDRCHRIGQTQPVLVIRLVTAGTIDETILQRAQTKRGLERLVLARRSFAMDSIDVLTQKAPKQSQQQQLSPPRRRMPHGWLRRSGHTHIWSDGSDQTLSKKELLQLLSKSDFHNAVSDVDQLSDDELRQLLDRTDMLQLWEQQKAGAVQSSDRTDNNNTAADCGSSTQLSESPCSPRAVAATTPLKRSRPNSPSTSPKRKRAYDSPELVQNKISGAESRLLLQCEP